MASVPVFLLGLWLVGLFSTLAIVQAISLDTPVPPLQWINLTPLLNGPAPPPLRDAALGYDETTRSLVIFGGESEGGFVQSRTYLLNLETLTWSTPSPPINLRGTPQARSGAVSGLDFAASNRHAFVVIGGRGSSDVALSDVWAFDFTNQFWSQVTISNNGPEPRWGASGGIDPRTEPVQDQLLPGPNNTFYLAGGLDRSRAFRQSDVWRLDISGILSANLPSNVLGSWQMIRLQDSLPGISRQGDTIIGQRIVSTGGCLDRLQDSDGDPSCALENSSVIDIAGRSFIAPSPCPAPRLDPILVPNTNSFSSRFASQVFLALGTVNVSLWDDGGGLGVGEVDILDLNTGSWSRVLPAGDPGSSGQVSFPSPREGAAVFSYTRGLVGSARESKADTIVFGGRDGTGKYLSEIWLLRSYQDALSPSSGTWSGYGDGNLRSGINADGSGVRVQYLDRCVTARNITSPVDNNNDNDEEPEEPLLSSLSLGLLLFSCLLLRLFPLAFRGHLLVNLRSSAIVFVIVCSYAIGVAGFVFAFTSSYVSISDTYIPQQPQRRSVHSFALAHFSTLHGIASFVLFTLLYGVTPILFLLSLTGTHRTHQHRQRRRVSEDAISEASVTLRNRDMSPSLVEKPDHLQRSTGPSPSPSVLYSPPISPPLHSATWSSYPPVAYNNHNNAAARRSFDALSLDDGRESPSMSGVPVTPKRGFEVLNRPGRTRGQSGSWPTTPGEQPSSTAPLAASTSRSLGEIDWLHRRRSLNAVGELDYALSVAHNAQRAGVHTPDPSSAHSTPKLNTIDNTRKPSLLHWSIYISTQVGLLGLNVVTLVALWFYAPKSAFYVYLVWVLVIYTCLAFIPRRFRTEDYIFARLVNPKMPPPSVDADAPPSHPLNPTDSVRGSIAPSGPYLHPPPFLRTIPAHTGDLRHTEPEQDEEDEDIDEDTRQRMIEEEMDRREVSIVTVPKRKLWVANPS
ncbi:hypothetical protein BKA70DRAFT_1257438 [Coprinopsis sp. MPI-PUGE-AT-0042]|nr:hypothetical protein BKA70DRAFT_1257438 [Coprinopsis sp. MPI-PUGE-AT-0042]